MLIGLELHYNQHVSERRGAGDGRFSAWHWLERRIQCLEETPKFFSRQSHGTP